MNDQNIFSITSVEVATEAGYKCVGRECGGVADRLIVIMQGQDKDEHIAELLYCQECEKKVRRGLDRVSGAFFESCLKMAKRREFHV